MIIRGYEVNEIVLVMIGAYLYTGVMGYMDYGIMGSIAFIPLIITAIWLTGFINKVEKKDV